MVNELLMWLLLLFRVDIIITVTNFFILNLYTNVSDKVGKVEWFSQSPCNLHLSSEGQQI